MGEKRQRWLSMTWCQHIQKQIRHTLQWKTSNQAVADGLPSLRKLTRSFSAVTRQLMAVLVAMFSRRCCNLQCQITSTAKSRKCNFGKKSKRRKKNKYIMGTGTQQNDCTGKP